MLQFPLFTILFVLVVRSTSVVSTSVDSVFLRSQQPNKDDDDYHTTINESLVYDSVQMIQDEYEQQQQQQQWEQEDHRHLQASTICVKTKLQIITRIRGGVRRIAVCASRTTMGGAARRERNRRRLSTMSGINLSHLDITIVCELEDPTQRCILDGEGESRIFYGFNTTLTLIGFIFTNATAGTSIGGALSFHGDSIITIENSAFIENDAAYGGAIAVTNSTLLFPNSSSVEFDHNFATNSGGAIYMDYGTADLVGVMLSANSAIENVSYVMMLSVS
jgi:predicted outer membrane repeat protein